MNFVIWAQVNVNEIVSYAFSGSIENIEFIDSHIGTILAFAINCVADVLFNVSFDDCVIDRIDSQAFKNMRLQHFMFRNTVVTSPVVNRAFYRLTIDDNLSVLNCTFDTIETGAFQAIGTFYTCSAIDWGNKNINNSNYYRCESFRFLG